MLKTVIKKLKSPRLKEFIIDIIDPFFKKQKNKIIFVVQDKTFFSGNIRIMCEYYLKYSKYDKIFIYKDGKCKSDIKNELEELGIKVLDSFNLNSIYHIVTSGVVFLSHNPRNIHISRKFNSRLIINLWHGVAIKKIENSMQFIPPAKQKLLNNHAKLYDMIIASSDEDKKTNIHAFKVPEDIVKVTGLPRYEILKDSYPLGNTLSKEKNKIELIKKEKKIILYAPTFRESNISAFEQILPAEWKILESFAKKNNFLIGLRPHPYDIKSLPEEIKNSSNFYLFDSKNFTEANLLLKYVDLLIVDFTSIWVDYLLLNRPILGFAKDYEHYLKNERGFVYNFDEIFPDHFTSDINSLIENITLRMLNDGINTNYQATKDVLHKYDLNIYFPELVYKEVESLRRKKFA